MPLVAYFQVCRIRHKGTPEEQAWQYADTDFDLLICLPGRNTTELGPHPLQHCMLVFPPAVVQHRGFMALPSQPPMPLGNTQFPFTTNSFPFPGSELVAIPRRHPLQLQADHR